MDNGFFSMLFRMKHIERWSLMHSLIPDYLSTHSLEVGFLSHALCVIGNRYFGKDYDTDRIVLKAIYHDMPEIFTGDIPTPVKYFSDETKNAYGSVENASLSKLVSMLPSEMQGDYRELFDYTAEEKIIIKAADRLSAYIKCREETNYGNREFVKAGERLLTAIKGMKCEEADYFISNFIESFDLPLDSVIDRNN